MKVLRLYILNLFIKDQDIVFYVASTQIFEILEILQIWKYSFLRVLKNTFSENMKSCFLKIYAKHPAKQRIFERRCRSTDNRW